MRTFRRSIFISRKRNVSEQNRSLHSPVLPQKSSPPRARHPDFASKSRERIAKFPEFRRAARAQEMRALGQRALRKPQHVDAAFLRFFSGFSPGEKE